MQFPSTWSPLTGAPSFQMWAAAILQHQHYDGVTGSSSPCLNLSHRSQWTSTLALHYQLLASVPAGEDQRHASGYKVLIM